MGPLMTLKVMPQYRHTF